MTSYFQHHVYFNAEQESVVKAYLARHEDETFSGLMRRLILTHVAKEMAPCATAAPTLTTR